MNASLSQRLVDSLSDVVEGSLHNDPGTLERYSRTQGWYRIPPLCVLQPSSIADVSNAIRVCADLGVAVLPRGAGTGLAGQAIGYGLVIDASSSMRSILDTGEEHVTVQSGVVLESLNAHLRNRGRWFPIDPTSAPHCTLGGMTATNAAGWHGPAYGATKDHILSCTIVLADGAVVRIGPSDGETDMEPRVSEITSRVESLLRPQEETIRSRFPRVAKNSSGYDLPGALDTTPVDLRKLIAGSEGTLAYIADITLKTSPLPAATGGVLVSSESYKPIVTLLQSIPPLTIAAAEFMDASFLSFGDFPASWRSGSSGPLLYIDLHAASRQGLTRSLETVENMVQSIDGLRFIALTGPERETVFTCRRAVSEQINFDTDRGKASFIEDVVVPLEHLGTYVSFVGELLSSRNIPYALYGHAAEGNIHCSPFVDIHRLDHYRMIDEIASSVASFVISLGGSLTGEHGDGFVRTPFLERSFGREVFGLFKGVKEIFDPQAVFHPGIITGKQEASILHDIASS